ncbi:SGNH/GDSL hydrolase family protein [Aquirufa regiilacus]|uniref:GDSL-type esterase/lipase family protein n=1 Tax=Aquirufa regiilacus TaxID=3024868 RepID=A0ABU3TQK0_9BACT|nr:MULTISPECIES: GDSL-type esterase/lipase family protein [unclassified Aquirufa]MDT8886890.1 GDSL-type esterase/lipase family protein [Aquirufa sp. LEPPI-3A]MDU0808145.1 GDSL-type esterase/lipase family protein [Aquirufa sp. LEOWEIH-7C]
MKTKILSIIILMALSLSSFKTAENPKRIVFFGDSITQAGVGKTGYITKMAEMLGTMGLASKYELIGAGIGGNKIYDLYLRHEEDVLAKNPNIVIIYVGINDVWHKTSSRTGTDADKFERFYNALINRLQKANIQVVICTPTVIGEKFDATNENDGDLNAYSNIIRKIATDNQCKLIDLRKTFLSFEEKNNIENKASGILTTDRVHLNEAGNQFLAETMWETIKTL